MAIHVANIGLTQVTPSGTVKSRANMTIKEAITASTEHRIIPNPSIPNTSGSPTIADYIVLEEAAGFGLAHIDQYFVITSTSEGSSGVISTVQRDVTFGNNVLVAAGPTYTPLSANSLLVLWFAVVGIAGNAADVMLGSAAGQPIAVAAGDRFDISAQVGTHIDLSDYGINGVAGDGVHLIYQEA